MFDNIYSCLLHPLCVPNCQALSHTPPAHHQQRSCRASPPMRVCLNNFLSGSTRPNLANWNRLPRWYFRPKWRKCGAKESESECMAKENICFWDHFLKRLLWGFQREYIFYFYGGRAFFPLPSINVRGKFRKQGDITLQA